MQKLEKVSTKWWFFVILLAAQSVLVPFVSRNFDPQNIPQMVSATLNNAPQVRLGQLNILFQALSLLMFVLLFMFKGFFGFFGKYNFVFINEILLFKFGFL